MALHKVIISGGGTGGHIFPALAIADEIKRRYPECEILFVGAYGRMEMEKVPERGYNIVGLNIAGIQRSLTLKNLKVPFLLLGSVVKARSVVKKMKPQVAVGVGGYASGPTLKMAAHLKVPTIIQEQNSFPGITNKLLARKAKAICVAYPHMERFFAKEKITLTGNPVRHEIVNSSEDKVESLKHFSLQDLPTVLIVGGSLGARKVNQFIHQHAEEITSQGYQIIWQTGKAYYETRLNELKSMSHSQLHILPFIQDMAKAYAAADVVISRAGALAISELAIAGKPVVFIPNPHLTEDHQTKNAMSLVDEGRAMIVRENELEEKLMATTISLLGDKERQQQYVEKIKAFAKPNATKDIVDQIEKWAK